MIEHSRRAPSTLVAVRAARTMCLAWLACAACLVDAGCETPESGEPARGQRPVPSLDDVSDLGNLSRTPLRRLTRAELHDTVLALTGVDTSERISAVPADALTPFDGDADTQFASTALIEATRGVAEEAAAGMFQDGGGGAETGGGPQTETFEAESAQFVNADGSSNEIYTNDQGSSILFLGAAGIRVPFHAERPGLHNIRVVMNGEEGGDELPRVEVRVDGVAELSFDVPGTGFAPYDGEFELTAGDHTIDVVFVNDFYDPDLGIDRNLAIDVVTMTSPAGSNLTSVGLGCVPTGPNDSTCLEDFIARFGRLALRRPLSADEVNEYLQFASASVEDDDFLVGARLVVAAFLQDPEFLYRVETGTVAGDGTIQLDGFSVASRLSFLLWGRGPDEALLEDAAAGRLDTAAGRRAVAARLLDDPLARSRTVRFHGMWFGVEDALSRVPESLRPSLAREFEAMTERVVFDEDRSWLELFTLNETFVDDALASHYGLALPGAGPQWTSLEGTGRAGVLGTGGYLAVGAKFTDTSPTQRGKAFRDRMLCTPVRSPTPEDLMGAVVNVDQPPPGDGCKFERYAQHAQGACAGCHSLMDPIGFGLERFDSTGRPRTHEPGTEPADLCPIDGGGDLDGLAFTGPAELGRALVDHAAFQECFARQLSRFVTGRQDAAEELDQVGALARLFASRSHRFKDLLLDVVEDESFARRRLPDDEGGAP